MVVVRSKRWPTMNLANIVAGNPQHGERQDLGIIVKCYTSVGKMKAYGTIEVDAREVINIDGGRVSHFAAVSIETAGDYPQSGATAISYDNIDRVCAAIDQISRTDPKYSKFKFIEAEAIIDDLKITVFNDANGKMHFSAATGIAAIHMDLSRIMELKRLFETAKNQIDTCKHQY